MGDDLSIFSVLSHPTLLLLGRALLRTETHSCGLSAAIDSLSSVCVHVPDSDLTCTNQTLAHVRRDEKYDFTLMTHLHGVLIPEAKNRRNVHQRLLNLSL